MGADGMSIALVSLDPHGAAGRVVFLQHPPPGFLLLGVQGGPAIGGQLAMVGTTAVFLAAHEVLGDMLPGDAAPIRIGPVP